MSDVGINIPLWLLLIYLGFDAWPVFLLAAALSALVAMLVRGILRWLLLGLAALLLVECGDATVFCYDRARQDAELEAGYRATHSTLDTPRKWMACCCPQARTSAGATTATPTCARPTCQDPHRCSATCWTPRVEEEDGRWSGSQSADAVLGGWPCPSGLVRLSRAGQLESCTLAADHAWQGRLVPRGSLIGYANGLDDGIPVTLLAGAGMAFPENGIILPGTSSLTLNLDGSLCDTYLESDKPFIVGGAGLWNSVSWRCPDGPAADGLSPAPLAVRGALLHDMDQAGQAIGAGNQVSVALPNGTVVIER